MQTTLLGEGRAGIAPEKWVECRQRPVGSEKHSAKNFHRSIILHARHQSDAKRGWEQHELFNEGSEVGDLDIYGGSILHFASAK